MLDDLDFINTWLDQTERLRIDTEAKRDDLSLEDFSAGLELERQAESDPAVCWRRVCAILDRRPSEFAVMTLALGPMHVLLNRHGDGLVEEIKDRATVDQGLRKALGWLRGSLSQSLSARLLPFIEVPGY